MTVAVHRHTSDSFPAFSKERLIPHFSPSWAEVFGEDDQGIFAKVRRFDFEFRWILPQLIQADGFLAKFVEGFWLAERAFPRESGSWGTEVVSKFIEDCAIANNCPIRLPTHTELLAAKETLRFVEAEKGITVTKEQTEICMNDSRALGLNTLIIYDILVDSLNMTVLETSAAEASNPYLRLAISAG